MGETYSNYPMGVNGSNDYFNQPDPPDDERDEEREEREEVHLPRGRARQLYDELMVRAREVPPCS